MDNNLIDLTEEPSREVAAPLPQEVLLIVYVHGFKGTDTTFGSFPSRLTHVLSETIENVRVESIVFPAYETKGDLDKAVERFADWLTTLTVEREVAQGAGGGAGKAKLVLCGHSMGGLLVADTLLAIIHNRVDPSAPVWPHIIAILAFDTPYLGLHPHVFKNSATKAFGTFADVAKATTDIWGAISEYSKSTATSAKQPAGLLTAPPSAPAAEAGGWAKWAPTAYAVGGALLAGAAAGTAYYRRSDILVSYTYLQDHMKYVGNLWEEKAMEERVVAILKAEEEHNVVFRNFYTLIPPDISTTVNARTFCVLPKTALAANHFIPARNTLAEDEIHAHTGMFEPSTNDGYYQLGLAVAGIVREALMRTRGQFESKQANDEKIAQQGSEFAADEPEVQAVTVQASTATADTGTETQQLAAHAAPSTATAEEGNPWA
ncbi:hypothetical protein PENSPDRAFT_647370 [Peniophora sp. CONT]|nr:hypothetical protein PENSPDRAFT_647370 [Peniophora sp. CONT]